MSGVAIVITCSDAKTYLRRQLVEQFFVHFHYLCYLPFRQCFIFLWLSLRQALSTRSSWATCCQRHIAVVSRALTFEMRERLLNLSLA